MSKYRNCLGWPNQLCIKIDFSLSHSDPNKCDFILEHFVYLFCIKSAYLKRYFLKCSSRTSTPPKVLFFIYYLLRFFFIYNLLILLIFQNLHTYWPVCGQVVLPNPSVLSTVLQYNFLCKKFTTYFVFLS